jgi:hypothetical protein
MNAAEVVITIDDLLLTDTFIANIDEAKSHYDVRAPYSSEMGIALANQMDRHVLANGILAARGSNVVTGLSGGSVIYTDDARTGSGSANFATNGDHLAEALFAAAEELDSKDVPEDDRYMFVRPAQYYKLVQAAKTINRDFGGAGTYAEGNVLKVAGISVVKTNQLPSTNITTGVEAGTSTRYAVDATNTVGLIMHKSAVATVKLMDLGTESEYDIRRQGTLMVAKYAVGHGVLRPEAAVEIRNAAS